VIARLVFVEKWAVQTGPPTSFSGP